jgi:hypothetical protein
MPERESFSRSLLNGLFTTLSDPAVAVRIAGARALVRLPIDAESSKLLGSVLPEFTPQEIIWTTFVPTPPIR